MVVDGFGCLGPFGSANGGEGSGFGWWRWLHEVVEAAVARWWGEHCFFHHVGDVSGPARPEWGPEHARDSHFQPVFHGTHRVSEWVNGGRERERVCDEEWEVFEGRKWGGRDINAWETESGSRININLKKNVCGATLCCFLFSRSLLCPGCLVIGSMR